MFENIPKNWKKEKLENITTVNYGTRIVKDSAIGNEYYVYGGGDKTFKTDIFNRENTLIVARFGMSPKCTRFVKGKFFLNDSGLTVDTNDEHLLNQNFLNWQLFFLNDLIYSLGKGVAQKNLNVSLFKNLDIIVPKSLNEQKEIVDVLDAAYRIIRLRKECIKSAQFLIPALFQEMFGDPLNNNKNLTKEKIGKIFTLTSGKFIPSKELDTNGQYPVYGGNGINGYHNEFLFEDSKICIGRVGVKCGCVHKTKPNSWITDNALYINNYLIPINETYLKEALTQINLNQYAKRAAQPVISQTTIYNQYILLPQIEQQELFATKVQEIEEYIKSQQAELENAKTMFQSLLHYAFMGKLTENITFEVKNE